MVADAQRHPDGGLAGVVDAVPRPGASRKVTVPVGTPAAEVTVAVSVTRWPKTAVAVDVLSVVVVFAAVVPVDVFNSTPTVLEEVLAATRSTRPSPFRSAAATPKGPSPPVRRSSRDQRLEGAVPVAGEHGEIARGGPQLIRHGSVQPAVVIEVAQGQIATPVGLSGAEEGSLEGAVALTQQHPDLKSVAVEKGDALDHQVELAVAVDVAQGQGLRREVLAAGRKDQGPRERAVAVAQQHADGVGELLRRHQVELAVAVEVADRDRARGPADGQVDPGPEGAVAVAQQHAEGAWLFAVTRSRAPLRSKSPAATERGVWPTGRIRWFGWNEPSPLPSRTSTAGPAGPGVFRATSGRPSPLKSPTATDWALPLPAPLLRTLVVTAGRNEPLPFPSSTLTLLWEAEDGPALTTARSGLPSLLKSATVTARGSTPTGKVTGGKN